MIMSNWMNNIFSWVGIHEVILPTLFINSQQFSIYPIVIGIILLLFLSMKNFNENIKKYLYFGLF